MDNENFHYVYFIESHKNEIKLKLSIPETYSESKTLELIYQPKNETPENNNSINLYRFKIYPDKISKKFKTPEDFEIEIIIEDENKNKCSAKIKNLDIGHDNYLYDFSMDSERAMDYQIQLYEIKLNNLEKFTIFINYLRDNNKFQNSKENDELVYSTIKNVINKDKKKEKSKNYEFAFLISLFLESFKSEYFPQIMEIFNPKDIEGYGELPEPEEKILTITSILNILDKKISKLFMDEKNKEQIYFNYFTISLYIKFKFNKDQFNKMLKLGDIQKYLYKTLFINEEFFKGLILSKEVIIGIINQFNNPNDKSNSLNFDQLSSILKYSNDVLVLLQIIKEKMELFCKYDQKKDSKIDIELLALPKKEDDIEAIFNLINEIITIEKRENKFFVKFSSTLIEKYIKLFNNADLGKLFSLRKIIQINNLNLSEKININQIIYQSGIYLSNKKIINNIEILNFIEKDNYYNDKTYQINKHISVDILTGINISLINDDFLKQWKKLKMFTIFEYQEKEFITKVCSLVKDIQYFNILFKLLNKNKNEDDVKKEYDTTLISIMQSTFVNLMKKDCSTENFPNLDISNDVIDLIYYTDIYNANSEDFNKYIQDRLSPDLVNNIYISLSENYKDLSKKLINIIINYYIEKPLIGKNLILVDIIIKSEKLRKDLLSNMKKYVIKENDIYQIEDTINFQILSGLIK